MSKLDDLRQQFLALSPDERRALWGRRKTRSDKTSSESVRKTTNKVLFELTTTDGKNFYPAALYEMSVEELNALPLEFDWSTGEGFSLFRCRAWEFVPEARAILRDKGRAAYEAWVERHRKRLIEFKTLTIPILLSLVEPRVGYTKTRLRRREDRKDTGEKGGLFRTYVREAAYKWFLSLSFKWDHIPPGLRHHAQRPFGLKPTDWSQCYHSGEMFPPGTPLFGLSLKR